VIKREPQGLDLGKGLHWSWAVHTLPGSVWIMPQPLQEAGDDSGCGGGVGRGQDLEHRRETTETIHCQQTVPAGSQCYGCGSD
jgi:hypothetical protein